jgi:hypothetical protein
MPSTDSRAAIDSRTDVLITNDAPAIAYAGAIGSYTITPLPWSRTYVLLTHGDIGAMPSPSDLSALARDVVRSDARAAQAPFWWQESACGTRKPLAWAPSASAPVLYYPQDDAIGRSLAERLVALAWPANRTPAWLRDALPAGYATAGAPTARPIDAAQMLVSLAPTSALAVIVAAPRTESAMCLAGVSTGSTLDWADSFGFRITPLLDARDQLIYRRGTGPIVLDGDGTIRFSNGKR